MTVGRKGRIHAIRNVYYYALLVIRAYIDIALIARYKLQSILCECLLTSRRAQGRELWGSRLRPLTLRAHSQGFRLSLDLSPRLAGQGCGDRDAAAGLLFYFTESLGV